MPVLSTFLPYGIIPIMAGEIGRLLGRFRPKAAVSEQTEIPRDPNLLTYQDIAGKPNLLGDFLGKKWTHQQTEHGWDFTYAPYGEHNGNISLVLSPASANLVLHTFGDFTSLNQYVQQPATYRLIKADRVRIPERSVVISSPEEAIVFYPESNRSERWIMHADGTMMPHDHLPLGALLRASQKTSSK